MGGGRAGGNRYAACAECQEDGTGGTAQFRPRHERGRALEDGLRHAGDRVLTRRMLAARPVASELVQAWTSIEASAGTLEIDALAEELGWSRKHLIRRFTDQFGLPPKRTARILRFSRAIGLLRAGAVESWSALAVDCGFYDQAHMIHNFHRFAGSAPAEFLARRLPDGGGVSGA